MPELMELTLAAEQSRELHESRWNSQGVRTAPEAVAWESAYAFLEDKARMKDALSGWARQPDAVADDELSRQTLALYQS